ncbi:hypothetical protein D3C73_778590 [compost metagenome]
MRKELLDVSSDSPLGRKYTISSYMTLRAAVKPQEWSHWQFVLSLDRVRCEVADHRRVSQWLKQPIGIAQTQITDDAHQKSDFLVDLLINGLFCNCDGMLEAFKKYSFCMGHFLLAVPQQVNVHVGDSIPGRQAPEHAVVEVNIE